MAKASLTAVATFAAMWLGHAAGAVSAASDHALISPIWPATGVNIALLLLLGWRVWPGIVIGSLAANWVVFGDWRVMAAGTPADVLEALVASGLIRRLTADLAPFLATRRAALSLFAAGLIGPLAGVALGSALFRLLDVSNGADGKVWHPWLHWLIADALSAIVITPVAVTWREHRRVPWITLPIAQAMIIVIGLLAVAAWLFTQPTPHGWLRPEPLLFLTLPFVVWAALSFGAWGASWGMLLLTVVAITGTLAGRGPFAGMGPPQSILLLQIYLGVTAVMALLLGSSTCARAAAHRQLSLQHEQVQQLLSELDHRVRNNLASLITMIDQTRRSAPDVHSYARSLGDRVHTMARTHDLTRGGRLREVRMVDLMLAVTPASFHDRIAMHGPDLMIVPRQAAALGMVINEFVTNSLKYGALSSPEGRIDLQWDGPTMIADGMSATVRWSERAGPRVQPAHIDGSGSSIVRGLVRSELQGDVRLTYPPEGATHDLTFVLEPSVAFNGR